MSPFSRRRHAASTNSRTRCSDAGLCRKRYTSPLLTWAVSADCSAAPPATMSTRSGNWRFEAADELRDRSSRVAAASRRQRRRRSARSCVARSVSAPTNSSSRSWAAAARTAAMSAASCVEHQQRLACGRTQSAREGLLGGRCGRLEADGAVQGNRISSFGARLAGPRLAGQVAPVLDDAAICLLLSPPTGRFCETRHPVAGRLPAGVGGSTFRPARRRYVRTVGRVREREAAWCWVLS